MTVGGIFPKWKESCQQHAPLAKLPNVTVLGQIVAALAVFPLGCAAGTETKLYEPGLLRRLRSPKRQGEGTPRRHRQRISNTMTTGTVSGQFLIFVWARRANVICHTAYRPTSTKERRETFGVVHAPDPARRSARCHTRSVRDWNASISSCI